MYFDTDSLEYDSSDDDEMSQSRYQEFQALDSNATKAALKAEQNFVTEIVKGITKAAGKPVRVRSHGHGQDDELMCTVDIQKGTLGPIVKWVRSQDTSRGNGVILDGYMSTRDFVFEDDATGKRYDLSDI